MGYLAIIGGSGVYNFDEVELLEEIDCETPFGKPSDKILKFKLAENEFYFLARHGRGHVLNPSEINYRANIYALKQLGVDTVVSISAVGSLKEEHAPGEFVVVDQFIDWTKGLRKRSFFEKGMVGHVSAADPISKDLKQRVVDCLGKTSIEYAKEGTYICIEGPQFSTRAESNIYRGFGASVIGMTNVPEAFLAKEAAMAYSTVAMVTDYDCWKEEHCTLEDIIKVMKENYISAQTFIKELVPNIAANPIQVVKENQYAVITNPELISENNNSIIQTLQK